MASQFTISLVWVPGHRDIVGGRVSQAGHHPASPPRKGKCHHAHGNLQAKYKKLFYLANTHWENAPQCRISHQTRPVINGKETSELLKFSRTECGMLVRALTDHWLV